MAKKKEPKEYLRPIDEEGDEGKAPPAPRDHNVRVGGVAVEQLRSIVERIEKLSEEKAAIAGDISEVYAEAKGNGFDIKGIRKIVALRKKDASEAEEEELIFDTYRRALGMLPQLDLFDEKGEADSGE